MDDVAERSAMILNQFARCAIVAADWQRSRRYSGTMHGTRATLNQFAECFAVAGE
jgi:hypothetical protein